MKQGLPMSAITMAEGSGRASGLFKNMKKMISVMPAAAGEKALVGASKFVQRALKFSSPTPKSFFSKKKIKKWFKIIPHICILNTCIYN